MVIKSELIPVFINIHKIKTKQIVIISKIKLIKSELKKAFDELNMKIQELTEINSNLHIKKEKVIDGN
jgi:hypothetical protein